MHRQEHLPFNWQDSYLISPCNDFIPELTWPGLCWRCGFGEDCHGGQVTL
jgi:hypothetical protein